jgi:hypothetical protein
VTRGLYVREMAEVLGFSYSRLKDKLYGRSPITLQIDRALANIEYCIARGVPPDAWPARLSGRIAAAYDEYDTHRSPQPRDHSPEN